MEKLSVIENGLVPVYQTDIGEKVVYGTELHEVLEVKSRYREWIERRFVDIDAVENEDFEAAEISAPSGQNRKEHIIKLDIAKEMAMLERNEKGKQVRKYFIQIEKKYKKVAIINNTRPLYSSFLRPSFSTIPPIRRRAIKAPITKILEARPANPSEAANCCIAYSAIVVISR